jgi:predicted RNA-binding Zn-ribbon protein involved in translation (DUF1610 family)
MGEAAGTLGDQSQIIGAHMEHVDRAQRAIPLDRHDIIEYHADRHVLVPAGTHDPPGQTAEVYFVCPHCGSFYEVLRRRAARQAGVAYEIMCARDFCRPAKANCCLNTFFGAKPIAVGIAQRSASDNVGCASERKGVGPVEDIGGDRSVRAVVVSFQQDLGVRSPIKRQHQPVSDNRKDNDDQRHGRRHAHVVDVDTVDDEEAKAALGGKHFADQHTEKC